MNIQEARQAHGKELGDLLTQQRRFESLMTWRRTIDRDAHDYADLILAHPEREQVEHLEVDIIMEACLIGLMAQQGWVEKVEAQQRAFRLGRVLRDRLRELEVPIDTLNANLGTIMNGVLEKIINLGIKTVS